jgi:uncharacterized membrane protein
LKHAGYAVLGIVSVVVLPWLLRRFVPPLAYAIPVAVNLALGALFASTLRCGSEPMIARFARAERGRLEFDLAAYARRLTWLWVALFVVSAALSALLAAAGLVRAWIFFTSFGNYAAVAALFIGEFQYRRRRFAQYEHATPRVLLAHVHSVLREWRRRAP